MRSWAHHGGSTRAGLLALLALAPACGVNSAPLPGADASGSGGSGGMGPRPRDAGSGLPEAGAGDAQPPTATACKVMLSPLAPARFTDIPAGEGYRFRVVAQVDLPADLQASGYKPTFQWSIVHESGQRFAHTTVDGDPAVIEFATEITGRYDISVDIPDTGSACADRKTAYAVTPSRLFARFRIRATPPQPRPGQVRDEERPLALLEADVMVSAGTPVTRTLDLQRAYPVRIDPQDENGVELPAYYVRISARSSTARFDGYLVPGRHRGFLAPLELGQRYDVLLVPDPAAGLLRAPLAYSGLLAEELRLQSFRVDPGRDVSGAVRTSEGPLPGALVRLRSGALPSTADETRSQGQFSLLAREGQFEVRVLPPEASGLPEAQLPQSSGLVVRPSATVTTVNLTYAPAAAGRFALTVQAPGGGAPQPGVRVLLESEPEALPNVGTFEIESGLRYPAVGIVRRVGTTDAAGVATFESVPRTRYRVTLVPGDAAAGDAAVTTLADLDLSAAGAASAQTVVLGRRARLVGRLSPAGVAAGLVVKAVDAAEDGAGRTVMATVAADGRYELPTDPGRVYRLFIEPPADRRVPRIPLEPVRARTTDLTLDRTLPARLSLSGSVLESGSPAAGVVIQVFCLGSAPTCIDPGSPDITSTPPIDETVSAADGRYQLYLPDPGQ